MYKKWSRKDKLLFWLVLATIGFIIVAIILNYFYKNIWEEIPKAILNLGIGVIIGGLVKFLLDEYREENEKKEKAKALEIELLNRLRHIFDQIELSKTLILSHRSAKTYGERIRGAVMPSIISLFDIKRSLVDTDENIDKEKLINIRLSLHYLIAYLTILVNEYREGYPEISNKQFYQEGIRGELRSKYAKTVVQKIDSRGTNEKSKELKEKDIIDLVGEGIPNDIQIVWDKIKVLLYLSDFLKEGHSIYYDIFIEHYEFCKRLLKSDKPIDQIFHPVSFNKKYLEKLEEIDLKKTNRKLTDEDNLVNILKDEIIKLIEKSLPPKNS